MVVSAGQRRRAHVVMPQALLDEVDNRVGQRRRSQFIQEAVEEKLGRLRRVESFDRVVGSLKNADSPEWETTESTEEWVRALRREWEGRSEADPATAP
jgi:metal-responsive CopG/Arc/MetJ family transcriptional regulator